MTRLFGAPVATEIRVIPVAGYDSDAVLEQGIDAIMSIVAGPASLDECLASAGELLKAAAARVCRMIGIGMRMGSSVHLVT